jgi:hypothetical protein
MLFSGSKTPQYVVERSTAQESNLPSVGLLRLTGFEDDEPKSQFAG